MSKIERVPITEKNSRTSCPRWSDLDFDSESVRMDNGYLHVPVHHSCDPNDVMWRVFPKSKHAKGVAKEADGTWVWIIVTKGRQIT